MLKQHNCSAARSGFTLVEMLIVIAVAGILMGLLIPVVQSARESARRIQCSSNLKQLGLAMHSYHAGHGVLPPAGIHPAKPGAIIPLRPASGFVAVLPYCGELALYEQWNFKIGPDFEPNQSLTRKPLAIHRCPSMQLHMSSRASCAERAAPSSYALSTGSHNRYDANIHGHNGAFVGQGPDYCRVRLDDIAATDGTSQTLLIGELGYTLAELTDTCFPGAMTQWAVCYPGQAIASTGGIFNSRHIVGHEYEVFRGDHPGGVNFVFADGAIHFIKDSIDARELDALATRDGSEQTEGF